MIRSMTGFGTAEGTVGGARVSVEIRSVNHRFFSPSIKLPGVLSRWEPEVREVLRRSVSRGHVTVSAKIDASQSAEAVIDEARFDAYVKRLRDLKDRYALDGPIDLATVLRLPDVITGEAIGEGTVGELTAIVERAVVELSTSRAAEGQRLGGFLGERIALIESAVGRLAERAPARMLEQRDRLKATIAELAAGIQVDEQRLAQEVAILADRLDVGEELDRFRSHLSAFREAIGGNGSEGVGKRLGFLLQELLREANTTGSKANDAAMVRDVVAIKEELERIREQVENLE
ncbi:MAG TPA: YicC/YloC family endoribonuclease [Gemmatimonadaceae bacterium]|nr:YicC/YloC family endoribonuclease [Gemmatimonadaceae bacterium]